MDLDDWHQASQTHISSVTVPTALTVGEMMGSTGKEVLDALAIGVEVAGRIGRPFNKYKKHGNFLPTSVIGGFGATAIACRLMGYRSIIPVTHLVYIFPGLRESTGAF